jgi:hypothetical protein
MAQFWHTSEETICTQLLLSQVLTVDPERLLLFSITSQVRFVKTDFSTPKPAIRIRPMLGSLRLEILQLGISPARPKPIRPGRIFFSGSKGRTRPPRCVFNGLLGSFRSFYCSQVRFVNPARPGPPLATENRDGVSSFGTGNPRRLNCQTGMTVGHLRS